LMTLPRGNGAPTAHALRRRTVSNDALMAGPAIAIEDEQVSLFLQDLWELHR